MVYSAEQVRRGLGSILDQVIAGETVFIERHGKPKAVIISYADYLLALESLKTLRGEEAEIK